MKQVTIQLQRLAWSLLSCLCLCSAQNPAAQEVEEQGFLNIANMVPSDKKCTVLIDTKELTPTGLPALSDTGWFMAPAGEHQLTLKIEGYQDASGVVRIEPQLSVLYAIFLQPLGKKTTADDKKPTAVIRIKRLSCNNDDSQFKLLAHSLCAEEEAFKIGSQSVILKYDTAQELATWNGGPFAVIHRGKTIGSCSGAQEKNSYILLLASNCEERFGALLVRNNRQTLPPWYKVKDKKKTSSTQPDGPAPGQ